MPKGVDGGIMTLEKNYKAWMNSLLDLGNRNPLLNLKKDGKNVLQITTPNINQLWKEIVINEDKLVYDPDIDKNRNAKTFCSSISQNETLSILGLLRKKAKTISEEQDVNVLYLSFGTLEWEDTVQKKQMSSPLILVPVSIMQDSIKAPISIKINEDEVLVNPTLAYRLKHDFKASLPDLVDENYEKTIEKIKEFAQNNGWNVKEEAYLRIFSFLKINMYKDLEKNKDVLFNHPIIKAFGGESDNVNFFAQSISVENLQNFSHDNQNAEENFQVVDADSSQQDAILFASKGISFVLQGPPGTGKSQTITNIIASKLAEGKKVLFVSEKKTALEVVYKRLKDVGLSDFCLSLHNTNAGKREALNQLETSLALSRKKITLSDSMKMDQSQFEIERKKLNDYANQLNKKIAPLNKSLFFAYGMIAKNEKTEDLLFEIPNVANTDLKKYRNCVTSILEFAKTLEVMDSKVNLNPWKNSTISNVSNSFLTEIQEKQSKYFPQIYEIIKLLDEIKNHFDMDFFASLGEIENLGKFLDIAKFSPLISNNGNIKTESTLKSKELFETKSKLATEYSELFNNSNSNIQSLLFINDFSKLDEISDKIKKIQEEIDSNSAYRVFSKDSSRIQFVEKNLEMTQNYLALKKEILQDYDESIFSIKITPKLKPMELRFKNVYKGATKLLNSNYREDVKLVNQFALDKNKKLSDEEILELIQKLLKCNECFREVESQESNMKFIFGSDYKKFESDFALIRKIIDNISVLKQSLKILSQLKSILEECGTINFENTNILANVNPQENPNWQELEDLAKNITGFKGKSNYYFTEKLFNDIDFVNSAVNYSEKIFELVEKITPFVDWFSLMFEKTENIKGLELKDLSLRASNCFEHIEQLENWIDYNISRQKLVDMDLGDFVSKIEENAISHKNILPVFEKRFFRLWIDLVIKDFPEVENFRINKQETLIEDFCNLDKKLFLINKGRIKAKLINDLPSLDSFTTGEVNILKKELGKQRKIMPIRQLFSQIPNLLTTLKPCLMMSPLTVSQFLESELYTFDTVIFDEASQVKTENALGAILRGKQLIIAGDRHQLPPTNFFEVQSQDDDFDSDEIDTSAGNSILDEAIFLPNRELLWHYRSRHENLIAFSNSNIYKNNLVTFPAPLGKIENWGVEYIYVENGFYNGKNTPKGNPIEAEKIAEMVFTHIKDFPNRSLGVITFGVVQEEAIESAINKKRKENPEYESFFAEDKQDAFFVKSLENVQGDERDTIIFGIGYGKDLNGKMSMRFGPLSMVGGERRLNVAITRAKYNVKLVGSILPTDIDTSRISQDGPKLLKKYIEFAMNGWENVSENTETDDYFELSSPFIDAVYDFLLENGYKVEKNVGFSDCKIDLAVKHPDLEDVYVLGIQCDGESYCSNRTSRDRDRLKTDILKLMGWKLHKIWSPSWSKDCVFEKQKLIKAIENGIINYKEGENDEEVEDSQSSKNLEENLEKEKILFHFQNEEKEDKSFISEEDKSKEEIAEFTFEEYKTYKTKALISETAIFDLIPQFEKIVETEQPVHIDIVAARLAPIIGKTKVTTSVKNLAEKLALIAKNKIKNENGFLCFYTLEDISVRTAGERTIFQISDKEILKAMQIVENNSIGIKKDELIRVTSKCFGFNKITEKMMTRFEYVYLLLDESKKQE